MADFDFNYTVGFTGDFGDIQKKIKVLTDGIKPIDLKAEFPNLDTGNAQKAIDEIGKSGTIKSLSLETKSFTDAMGNLHEEIVKVSGSYQTLQGHTVRFSQAIPNAITGLEKQSKTYEHMIKKADEWSTRAETMGEKDKTAIQGTSAALKENIAKWEVLKGKYGQASPEARKVQEEIDRLNKELDKNIAASKRSAVATQSWGDRMAAAIKQTVTYTLSIGMVRKAQQELNKAIQFAIQLNTEMTKIQVLQAEGAQTPEEINELAQSFNSLAKEMGTTTIAIAEGSVEWLRQGKTVQETQELLRASTMLSKLGALSAAEATEYLTSTLNSYGMAAEEAVSIVDKLVQVDNISATSTKELATALRYSAATAKEAGVELEQLVSYIAVVSSTTRQNAESIGQGMKTMFTRMQDIKAGAIDEDGLGLNNVESALARVNIALRDTPTSFRDMSAVLEDVAAKWSTLNDIEQANIAKAIAGVRQQNLFMVLMQNMGKALEYQNEQFNANGVALDRYGIYLDSIEAKQQTFKATLEELYMNLDLQNIIKGLIDIGTGFLKMIDGLGGVVKAISTLIGIYGALLIIKKKDALITAFNTLLYHKQVLSLSRNTLETLNYVKALVLETFAKKKSASASKALTAANALLGNPLAILAVTLTAIIGLWQAFGTSAKKAAEAMSQGRQSLDDYNSSISGLKNTYKKNIELVKEYQDLVAKKSLKGLDTSEEERVLEINEQILDLYPILNTYKEEELSTLLKNKDVQEQLLKIEEARYRLEQKKSFEENKKNIKAGLESYVKDYKKAFAEIDFYKQSRLRTEGDDSLSPFDKNKILQDFDDAIEKEEDKILDFYIYYKDIDEYTRSLLAKEYPIFWEDWSKSAEAAIDYVESKMKEVLPSEQGYQVTEYKKDEDFEQPMGTKGLLTETQKIIDDLEKINSIREKLANTGIISYEELELLIKAGEKYSIQADSLLEITNSTEDYVDILIDAVAESENMNDVQKEIMRQWVLSAEATRKAEEANRAHSDSLKQASSQIGVLTNALKEQASTGHISNQTYIDLIASNNNLRGAIDGTSGAYTINIEKARDVAYATMYAAMAAAGLGPAAEAAGQGLYSMALDAIIASSAIDEVKQDMIDLLKIFEAFDSQIKFPSYGGGGGSSGPSAEEQAINAEIKALEKKKKEIQKAAEKRIKALEKEKKAIEEARDAEVERLEEIIEGYEEEIDLLEKKKDAFNELIDKQKESLEIAKDADDFARDQAKKATELSTLRTQIANISLDTSEEGIARRLELEQEASELEEEIAEDSAERKYDLQIDALDRMAEAFEEATDRQIEAIELQIEAIEKQIEAVEDLAEAQIEAIEKQIEAIREETDALIEAIDEQIEALREQLDALRESGESSAKGISEGFGGVEKSIAELRKELAKYGIDLSKISDSEIKRLSKLTGAWGEVKHAIREAREEALKLLDYKQVLPGGLLGQYTDEPIPAEKHEGGIIESHHSGNFAGNLKSNEVFAKLLKGEYVATENQMDNFLKQVFPKLATHPDIRNISNSNQSVGDIHVNMPITVQGNMDSSVIPQIDQISKRVIDDINKALVARGHIRNSNITIS